LGLFQDLNREELQFKLTFSMGEKAADFVAELWSLLVSAQRSPRGIPPKLEKAAAMAAAELVSATWIPRCRGLSKLVAVVLGRVAVR
jgi:hypothetical protein